MSMMVAKLRAPALKLEIPGDNDLKGVFRARIDQIRDQLAHTLQQCHYFGNCDGLLAISVTVMKG